MTNIRTETINTTSTNEVTRYTLCQQKQPKCPFQQHAFPMNNLIVIILMKIGIVHATIIDMLLPDVDTNFLFITEVLPP